MALALKKSLSSLFGSLHIICILFLFAISGSCALASTSEAQVVEIISNQEIRVKAPLHRFQVSQVLALFTQHPPYFVYGFAEVREIKNFDLFAEITLRIRSMIENKIVRPGDGVKALDLSSPVEAYPGQSALIVSEPLRETSSKYRALFTQGFSNGDAAETLSKNEVYVNYLGQTYVGVYDFLSVGTILPADLIGGPNLALKLRLIKGTSNIISMGINATKIPQSNTTTINLNFLWDSFSNQNMLTHTFATLAVYSLDNAQEASALKSVGTSSLQTGYEFILDNWDRVLAGPNYNFETKAIGGYVSYLWIWNRFHFQISLNSTNIRSLKLSPVDGYFGFIDAYWRY